ncbi:hypothetical protein KIW84_055901 [Lathyrus oleraceus]|uniref:Uncharacterized protein n=1 Tax=Pisum sativum TaxID=3888 RepID=A0A9D4X1N2_PEA|nr:hypothetical protein KIW84_055901 [Pisum sativum]
MYGLADVVVLPSTFAPYRLHGKFLTTIISWLHKVVKMSIVCEPNYIPLSVEVKEQLLYAIEEVVKLNISLVNVIFVVILEYKWFWISHGFFIGFGLGYFVM